MPHPESQLIDHLKTAVVLITKEEHISFLNAAAQNFFHISLQRATNRALKDLFAEGDHYDDIQKIILTADKNNAPYTQHQIKATLSHSKSCTFDISVTPLKKNYLIEIYPIDRIARIQSEKQLYQAQETTKNLIRNLAHEIKNPLAGLRGAAQLLNMEIGNNALSEYTDIIISETNRLSEVVDNLLLPHRESNFSIINIHEIIEQVAKLLHTEIKNHQLSITIERQYDPSIPDLIADKTQLMQAILNIANNALQALKREAKSGKITFKSSVKRKFTIDEFCHKLVCKIDIIDNGPGIQKSLHHSLFLPMISGQEQGTGLGLSIAQSIINHHQGLITFTSTRGETCFSIYLPLKMHNS